MAKAYTHGPRQPPAEWSQALPPCCYQSCHIIIIPILQIKRLELKEVKPFGWVPQGENWTLTMATRLQNSCLGPLCQKVTRSFCSSGKTKTPNVMNEILISHTHSTGVMFNSRHRTSSLPCSPPLQYILEQWFSTL